MSNGTFKFLKGIFWGATIGSIATLLLTPKTGKEIRKDVADRADNAKESAKEYINIAREKASEVSQEFQTAGEELWETGSQTFDQLKDDLHEGEDLQHTFEDVRDTYEAGKDLASEIISDTAEDIRQTSTDESDNYNA